MRRILKAAAAALLIAAVAVTGFAATSPSKTTPSRSSSSGGGGGSSNGNSSSYAILVDGKVVIVDRETGAATNSNGSGPVGYQTSSNTPSTAPTVAADWSVSGSNWRNGTLANQFANVPNPYAGGATQLFYFDAAGNVVSGWQWITLPSGLRACYYFNPAHNGSFGAAQLGGTTPDGYQLNAEGQWVVEGVVQTK